MQVADVQKLIAAAGVRQTERAAAADKDRREHVEREAAKDLRLKKVHDRARAVAAELFRWADGDVGTVIRAAMRDAGLAYIPLSDNIALSSTPGMLHVHRHGGPPPYGGMGRVDKDTSDENDLFVVRDEEIVAIADDIRSGRVLDKIAEHLRAATP